MVRIELEAACASRMRSGWRSSRPSRIRCRRTSSRSWRKRSGGNPQFLRDLLRSAIESGGVADLPDSAEAAAMARIDALAPEDRALVRRAAVFGLTFHPRMLSWFADDGDGAVAGARDAGPGCRISSTRNPTATCASAARCCATRPTRGCRTSFAGDSTARSPRDIEEEMDYPEEAADILSLHYFVAGEYRSGVAVRDGRGQARRRRLRVRRSRRAVLARAGGRTPPRRCRRARSSPPCTRRWAIRGIGPASSARRPTRTRPRAALVASDPLADAELLLKLSHVEEKLGKYEQALRWAEQARTALQGLDGPEAARQAARIERLVRDGASDAKGETTDALDWAERTVAEAEAADDPEALGDAYFVMGWAYGELGKEGAQPLMQRSLEAYQRAGNLVRQAGRPDEPRRRLPVGRPLGRGAVLLRARPRRGGEDRQTRSTRPWRASTSPRS